MKKIITLVCFFITLNKAFSQDAPFAVVTPSNVTFICPNFDSAYKKASSGDIIYVPGGTYNIGSYTIDKRLTIIGVGHYQDSSLATSASILYGDLFYTRNGNNSVIDGIYLSGNIGNYGPDSLKNISVYNTNFSNVENRGNYLTGWNFKNCIYRGGHGSSYQLLSYNFSFSNCIFHQNHFWSYGTIFKNCIFLQGGLQLDNTINALYANSIFIATGGYSGYTNTCTFTNCSFSGTSPDPANTSSSYENVAAADIFVRQSGNAFSYADDYHIKTSSVIYNKGIGIFEGSQPYTMGAIPNNPHIRTKEVSPTTGKDGKLKIKVNVSTQ